MRYLGRALLCRWILAAMLATLAFVAFWPSPIDQPIQGQLVRVLSFLHRHGIPGWFNYSVLEASANVALFVPLGAVAALAFPGKGWWQVGVFGLVVSVCMELGQLLFLDARVPSPLDLVTNTVGTLIGALLALTTLKWVYARRLSAAGAAGDY